jgi:hypothetical protein
LTTLTIKIPDELARSLEEVALAKKTTVSQLAIDRLRSAVEPAAGPRFGTVAALLSVMDGPPHVTADDVAELGAAIASGRMPVRGHDLFPE